MPWAWGIVVQAPQNEGMESLNNINILSLADTAISFTTAFFWVA